MIEAVADSTADIDERFLSEYSCNLQGTSDFLRIINFGVAHREPMAHLTLILQLLSALEHDEVYALPATASAKRTEAMEVTREGFVITTKPDRPRARTVLLLPLWRKSHNPHESENIEEAVQLLLTQRDWYPDNSFARNFITAAENNTHDALEQFTGNHFCVPRRTVLRHKGQLAQDPFGATLLTVYTPLKNPDQDRIATLQKQWEKAWGGAITIKST